jgi:hydroxyacylglutathione hydrolase
MLVKQIKANGDRNFAYIIADENSHEAAIIDPSFGASEVLNELQQLNLTAKYLINTHNHYDHTADNASILKKTKGKWLTKLHDGEQVKLGTITLQIIATPGHTADSICILAEKKLFTGDTIFVGDVGITSSTAEAQAEFASLKKLLQLPDDIVIFPGHDYGTKPSSTIGYEKLHSPALICVGHDDFQRFLIEK